MVKYILERLINDYIQTPPNKASRNICPSPPVKSPLINIVLYNAQFILCNTPGTRIKSPESGHFLSFTSIKPSISIEETQGLQQFYL